MSKYNKRLLWAVVEHLGCEQQHLAMPAQDQGLFWGLWDGTSGLVKIKIAVYDHFRKLSKLVVVKEIDMVELSTDPAGNKPVSRLWNRTKIHAWWFWVRFLSFVGHCTSFLPTAIVVGMGMFIQVPSERLFDFWMFASATISLEVCVGCLRSKYATVTKFIQLEIAECDESKKKDLVARLSDAIHKRRVCWFFVGIVLTNWMFVGFCEVWHLAYPRDYTATGVLALAPWHRQAVAFLSGANFLIACTKMWGLACEKVEEDQLSHELSVSSASFRKHNLEPIPENAEALAGGGTAE